MPGLSERSLHVEHVSELNKGPINELIDSGKFDRLHLGSYFCEELLPTVEDIESAVSFCSSRKLLFSLVIPVLGGRGWGQLGAVSNFLKIICRDLRGHRPEIIVNDWGALSTLAPERDTAIVAGRLFGKRWADPRLTIIWAQLDDSLQRRYRQSSVCAKGFRALLVDRGATAVETDCPPWGLDFELFEDTGVSVHDNLTWVATTRRCPTRALFAAERSARGGKCARPCLDQVLRLKHEHFDLLLRGNTYYTTTTVPGHQSIRRLIVPCWHVLRTTNADQRAFLNT